MSITSDSRLTLVGMITPLDAVTQRPSAPTFVDLRQRVPQDRVTDTFLTVGPIAWPLLGREVLGTGGRWWAIADISNVVDPFTELPAGATVRVPALERLLFDVLET